MNRQTKILIRQVLWACASLLIVANYNACSAYESDLSNLTEEAESQGNSPTPTPTATPVPTASPMPTQVPVVTVTPTTTPFLTPTQTPSPNANADFQRRCTAVGVIKCVNFDSESELTANGNTTLPSNDGVNRFAIDRNISASGTGSLRFDIPAGTGMSRMAGVFLAPMNAEFGARNLSRFNGNNKVYVQFKQRFTKEFTPAINPATGQRYNLGSLHFKQAAINNSDKCGDETIVTEATRSKYGFPILYSDCGSEHLQMNGNSAPTIYQWGKDDIFCARADLNAGDSSKCAMYKADQWITFYYEIEFGDEDTSNTVVRAFIQYQGEHMKQFIDYKSLNMNFDRGGSSNQAIKNVTFLPYITDNKTANGIEAASTWYDELIISRQPIAEPQF